MTNGVERTREEDFLAHGVNDWVSAAEVLGFAEDAGIANADDQRDFAIGLIARLLLAGYVEPGDTPRGGNGFAPWNSSPEDAVIRIVRAWLARSDPSVMPGEIVWLRNTPAGDEIGTAILARETGEQ